MAEDAFGLSLTNATPEVEAHIAAFENGLLNFDDGLETMLVVADEAPDCPAAQVYAAALGAYGQTQASFDSAQERLARAQSLPATAREQQWIRALLLGTRRDFDGAADALEELTLEWPEDLPAAKLCEFFYFCRGQAYSGERFLKHMTRLRPVHGSHPDFLSMDAFACELSGKPEEALNTARRAVQLRGQNPWAHHAIAHAHQRLNTPRAGVQELESLSPYWRDSGALIRCHNWWHLGVLYLETDQIESAWNVQRDHIWGNLPDLVGEQIDAISLLWRLEMHGQTVPASIWEDIAKHVKAHESDGTVLFNTAHFVYALERAGRSTRELLDCVQEQAKDAPECQRAVWQDVGASLLPAVQACARRDFQACLQCYGPIAQGDFLRGGGSDAQCALFEDMHAFAQKMSPTRGASPRG